jgi:hypothetical protein
MLSQVLFGKTVIISMDQEILIMMCQTDLGLMQITHLSVQNLFSILHDAIIFQGNGKFQAQDMQLGALECKVYQSVLMNTKSQIDFDRLLQLQMLDNTE